MVSLNHWMMLVFMSVIGNIWIYLDLQDLLPINGKLKSLDDACFYLGDWNIWIYLDL